MVGVIIEVAADRGLPAPGPQISRSFARGTTGLEPGGSAQLPGDPGGMLGPDGGDHEVSWTRRSCAARPSAFLRDQRRRAAGPVRPIQALDLAHAQAKPLGNLSLCNAPLVDLQHPLGTVQLSSAHRQGPKIHGGTDRPNPTFLSWRNPTISFWAYSQIARKATLC